MPNTPHPLLPPPPVLSTVRLFPPVTGQVQLQFQTLGFAASELPFGSEKKKGKGKGKGFEEEAALPDFSLLGWRLYEKMPNKFCQVNKFVFSPPTRKTTFCRMSCSMSWP